MQSNPCPACGRDRGTGRTVTGVDDQGDMILDDPQPSTFCEPCFIGIDPASAWPRPRRPEYQGLPRTACGWAELADGTLVAPGDQY
jgi:hypothetical protein